MLRPLAWLATSVSLALLPVAAQAAPVRTATPLSSKSEQLAGVPVVGLVAGIAVFALILILLIDDDNQDVPHSP